jgi:hypothetical protein
MFKKVVEFSVILKLELLFSLIISSSWTSKLKTSDLIERRPSDAYIFTRHITNRKKWLVRNHKANT